MRFLLGPWTTGAGFTRQTDRGFNLPELMMTIGIIGAITAVTVMHFGSARQGIKSDEVMRVVRAQLNTARELSISEGRNMQLQFPAQNVLQIVRQDVPGGSTVVGAVLFESGFE